MQIPIFINSRDRVGPLSDMVAWFEQAGAEEMYLIDNDSTFEPLLEYYERSPHSVIRLGHNAGKNALWTEPGVFDLTRNRYFAYSDSDIVPDPACPPDALDIFIELLGRYPGVNKAGFGIRYDDIPDHYMHKADAVAWERYQRAFPLDRRTDYRIIDTGFAVYRPNASVKPHNAAATRFPYVARHTSYYLDLNNLSDEDAFYLRRSDEVRERQEFFHWASQELSWVKEMPMPGLLDRIRWRVGGRRAVRTQMPGR